MRKRSRSGYSIILGPSLALALIASVLTIGVGSVAAAGPGSVGSVVWSDDNGNGRQDSSESGLAGVEVELRTRRGRLVSTTTTAADGSYVFDDVAAARYRVRVRVPADKQATTRKASAVRVQSSSKVEAAAVGLAAAPGDISGVVFADRGVDGLMDLPFGDTGIAGVRLDLEGVDATGKKVKERVQTAADGTFAFSGIPAGSYVLVQKQVKYYEDGEDTPGTNATLGTGASQLLIELPVGGSSSGNMFSEIPTSSLGGSVYLDDDDNGEFDVDLDEVGLPGVMVTLNGTDEDGNAVNLTSGTDFDGAYLFPRLRPGVYTITETQPALYADGKDTVGSAGGRNRTSDVITDIRLRRETDGVGYDFGELPLVP